MDANSPHLGPPLCGAHPTTQVLTSQGNFMTVRFAANPSVGGRGFNASYRAVSGGEWFLKQQFERLQLLSKWFTLV